jgi:hypothetical protein
LARGEKPVRLPFFDVDANPTHPLMGDTLADPAALLKFDIFHNTRRLLWLQRPIQPKMNVWLNPDFLKNSSVAQS